MLVNGKRSVGLALMIAVAAAGCGGADGAGTGYAGRMLAAPLPKPDFTFTDVHGRPFGFRAETDGKVTLLFFGYTHCPDICPVQLANIAAVLRDLPAETQEQIRVVFVTTDPARDTPERLREWLASHHPAFVGLRGPLHEVNAVERSLLLPPSVVAPGAGAGHGGTPSDYFVGHASAVVAFGADDTARVVYPWGTRQQDWRRDLPRLVAETGGPGAGG